MRRILFTETNFNTLPNPPAGFRYIGFDGPNFSEKDETGTTTPTGGATAAGGGMVDTTYSVLVSKIEAGILVPGTYYNIADFKTCYDQPDYSDRYTAVLSGNYKEGATHSLIVLAIASDKLAAEAYQPDYPKDLIRYDVSFTQSEVTSGTAYGRITERIDEFGNRTDYDHREVLFKRYKQYYYAPTDKLTGTIQISEEGNVTGTGTTFSSQIVVDQIIAVPSANIFLKVVSIADDFTMSVTGSYVPNISGEFYSAFNSGYVSYYKDNIDPTDYVENYTFHEITAYNNYFGDYSNQRVWEEMQFILPNNVMKGGACNNNKFGDMCFNNTFDDDCTNNRIADWFYQNCTNYDFDENEVGGYFYDNVITARIRRNKIRNQFSNNNIICNSLYRNEIGNYFGNNTISGDSDFNDNRLGNYFEENTITSNFNDNKVENNFYQNTIRGNFYQNSIGQSFYQNLVYNNFYSNNIGSDFHNNEIGSLLEIYGSQFSYNDIGNSFKGNLIIQYFSSNRIGYGFSWNEVYGDMWENDLGVVFIGNDIQDYFTSNTVGEWFEGNTIGDNFSHNTIGKNFRINQIENDFGFGGGQARGNTIGNYFEYNSIGEYFYDNRVADLFSYNILGDYFQLNDIKVNYLNSIDFRDNYNYIQSFTTNIGASPSIAGTDGTYSNIGATGGSGHGAEFDVTVSGSVVTSVVIQEVGYQYVAGDTLTIPYNLFGGTAGSDIQITVGTVSGTPSVYGAYNTEIFKRAGGTNRLSYYDADDVLTIKGITE